MDKTPLPPHNIEAEEAVIGSLVIDGEAYYLIDGLITPDDFYLKKHAVIFEAISDLYHRQKPIDLLTISNTLEQRGLISEIGALTDYVNVTPTSIHLEYYANIVFERAIHRRLIKAGADIVKLAYQATESDPEILVTDALDIITQVQTGLVKTGLVPPKQAANKLLDRLERKSLGQEEPGLKTGLRAIDNLLGGMVKGALYILAGRPGMGKSGFAISIARLAIENKKRVAYFSLEMPEENVIGRMAAQISGVSFAAINAGKVSDKQYSEFVEAVFFLEQTSCFSIDDSAASYASVIRSRAKREKILNGVDLVIVDHFGLARSNKKNGSDYSEASDVANQAMALAKETNAPVLALVQLNRAVESRTDKRPTMADLRDTGKWEENAHAIMTLYRDGYYNKDAEYSNVAEIILAKNREGRTGEASAFWKADTTEFIDLEVKTQPLNY